MFNGRHYSTTRPSRSPETIPTSSPHSTVDDLTFPIRRTSQAPKNTYIRDQLRDWSVKHEQDKIAQAPDELPAFGKIASLPLAYFLPEPSGDEDDFSDHTTSPADDWGGSQDAAPYMLEPGDLTLVYPKGYERTQLGVYLGSLGFQDMFLLHNGRWLAFEDTQPPRLVIRGFASPDEIADPTLTKHLARRPIERESIPGHKEDVAYVGDVIATATNPLVQRMTALEHEILDFQRNNLLLLDSIYDTYANETEYVHIPFAKLLQRLVGLKPSRAAQWAVIYTLLKDQINHILYELRRGETLSVLFVPKRLKRTNASVIQWARQFQEAAARASAGSDVSKSLRQNPITSFIEKSRRIILASRKFRSPTTTGTLGPSKHQHRSADGSIQTQSTGETWSDTDIMILDFIWDVYCRKPYSTGITRQHASASLILRAVGAYPKMELSRVIGGLFLQEIGAAVPCYTSLPTYVIAPVPGTQGCKELTDARAAADELAHGLGFAHRPLSDPLPDSLQDIRRDLADLEVFCIDSASTTIIDDGISLEPCVEKPGCHWLHAHIAHPTAFFDKDHAFARSARMQVESIYASDAHYDMLPTPVAEAMSVSKGAATMTVSTLIAKDGTVLDIKVQPTKVNNVIKLSTEAVEQLMSPEKGETATLVVGTDRRFTPDSGPKATAEDLEQVRHHLHTLQTIDTVLDARTLARRRETPEFWDRWVSERGNRVKISNLGPLDPLRHHRSFHHLGDPTIKLQATRFMLKMRHSEGDGDRSLGPSVLQQSMVLAGESFGKWCRDRNLPIIYYGAQFHPYYTVSKINELDHGIKFRPPKVVLSVQPIPAPLPNTKQYTRVTSPLRRFPDMIAQWNINTYLQAEAQGKISPGAVVDENIRLPWPEEDIQDFIDNEALISPFVSALEGTAAQDYAAHALFRAFHFQEAKLPEVWDVQIQRKITQAASRAWAAPMLAGMGLAAESGFLGTLLPFRMRVMVLKSKKGWEDSAKAQQFLPCKLELVDASRRVVYVTAVGPPSDDYTQKDPIKIWSLTGREEGKQAKST